MLGTTTITPIHTIITCHLPSFSVRGKLTLQLIRTATLRNSLHHTMATFHIPTAGMVERSMDVKEGV